MASTSASAEHTKPRLWFGRQADLAYLLGRSTSTGLTAVVGRPLTGTTRLLLETRDRLSEQGFVAGYAESTGDRRDLLLRALKDACAHVPAGELSAVAGDAGDDRTDILAHVSAAALEAVLPGEPGEVLKLAGRTAVEVRPIGLDPPRLTHDEALRLTAFLSSVAQKPVALFLDAWQQCSPAAEAAAMLRTFLEHADTWPACHVFVGAGLDDTPGQEAKACLVELGAGSPLAEIRELGGMDLRDTGERGRLLEYLADEVPVTREIEPTLTMRLLDGHPGVLHRWLTTKPGTPEALERLADDARLYRYPELHGLFLERCRSTPRVARLLAALAVLPRLNDESVWRPLAPVLLGDLDQATVSALRADGVLEPVDGADDVPSYGHDTRHDAAGGAWLSGDESVLQQVARGEIKRLVPALAERVTDLGIDSSVFAAALAAILEHEAELRLKGSLLRLCRYAASLFSSSIGSLDLDDLGAKAARTVHDYPGATTLVALALADIECLAGRAGDRARRDAFLKDLRLLCGRHPDDAAVRERLAVALVNAASQASLEGDPAFHHVVLKELRSLCAGHPLDATVRERLATALVNAADHAGSEGDWAGADVLLNELRRLGAEHPGDPAVRERLATALVGAADQASPQARRTARNDPLEELRRLCGEHPGDAAVRERLATALVNTTDRACREGRPACRDSLLEELRRLHAEHPGDAAVRERLAAACVSAMNRAIREEHPAWRDALLRELRELSDEHPEDGPVREWLAAALYNTVVHIHRGKDRGRRDGLLDELRALCARHALDTTLQQRLTMALFDMPTLLPPDRD